MSNGDEETKGTLLPDSIAQNPSPVPESGQEYQTDRQNLVNAIMATFRGLLPSNYVAQVNGPWYSLQFQAIAEQLAAFQITAQEIYKDSDWDFTRPEYLWEVLGTLIFPDADARTGIPTVDGDIDYRTFLKQMALLLLRGATPAVVEEGAELLTDAQAQLIEKFLAAADRDPNGYWTIDNQFEMELNMLAGDPPGTEFPEDPFTLQENIVLIEEALKPAHSLIQYRHLFLDVFGTLFEDEMSWDLWSYYYDDLRKNCYGAERVTGDAGETLSDLTLFSDVTREFDAVHIGAILRIDTGPNAGTHEVTDVRTFIFGDDATARAYTTSPTGLSGTATVVDGDIIDPLQDFGVVEEGETLTFTEGPNAGTYRLLTLLGNDGGPVGVATGPATGVRPAPCLLRVSRKMTQAQTGQSYIVDADRLGFRTPRTVTGEDVSEQFWI